MTQITDFAFDASRLCQAIRYNKAWTEYHNHIANTVLHAARLAVQDVENNRSDVSFRVVSAPTGSGKTIGSIAVASAGVLRDEFSAAFVFETIRQVDEVGAELIDLCGPEYVKVWSSGHDLAHSEQKQAEIELEHGKLRCPRSLKRDLREARIVVVTHALWKGEIERDKQGGVRYCKGQRRSVIFVDEHPDLVRLVERQPHDFMQLRDLILERNPDHPAIAVLNGIIEVADQAVNSDGQPYHPCILSVADHLELFGHRGNPRRTAAALGIEGVGENILGEIDLTCRFLVASTRGCSFLSRQGRTLVAYELEFEPGPGHVLLDATADITGMVSLMEGVETVPVEAVDFSNLEIVHVHQPIQFRRVSDVVQKARLARPYADWIRETVLAHTQPGDDVLVVVHKAMIDRRYMEGSEDPDKPMDWENRKVNTIHWGIGIGSNKYRNKMVVFSFSEFHRPRRAAIADAYGWTDIKPNIKNIADANVFPNPKGIFLTARDGHLLRWNKQLACRGNVRNIDPEGKCGRMKWVTSMDPDRLIASVPIMFPGAPLPAIGKPEEGQRESKAEKLQRLLITTDGDTLWADAIEHLTGIKANQLAWEIHRNISLQVTMKHCGWELVSAKDLGKPGRMKVLVQHSRKPRMITLILYPHEGRDGSHTDKFDAYLDDVLILTSRQPLLNGARKLLEMGHSPDQLLTARHHDRPYPSFVARPIGDVAKWTIKEPNRGRMQLTQWQPYNDPHSYPVASPAADVELAGIRIHSLA